MNDESPPSASSHFESATDVNFAYAFNWWMKRRNDNTSTLCLIGNPTEFSSDLQFKTLTNSWGGSEWMDTEPRYGVHALKMLEQGSIIAGFREYYAGEVFRPLMLIEDAYWGLREEELVLYTLKIAPHMKDKILEIEPINQPAAERIKSSIKNNTAIVLKNKIQLDTGDFIQPVLVMALTHKPHYEEMIARLGGNLTPREKHESDIEFLYSKAQP